MTHQTRVYIHGLIQATIGGIASGFLMIGVDPDHINMASYPGFRRLLATMAISGGVGLFLYLRDHPIPAPKDTDYAQAAQQAVAKVLGTGSGTGDGLPKVSVQSQIEGKGLAASIETSQSGDKGSADVKVRTDAKE